MKTSLDETLGVEVEEDTLHMVASNKSLQYLSQ